MRAYVMALDPRAIERRDDWNEYPARVLERNGNLTLVEFEDGHEEYLAPHELGRPIREGR